MGVQKLRHRVRRCLLRAVLRYTRRHGRPRMACRALGGIHPALRRHRLADELRGRAADPAAGVRASSLVVRNHWGLVAWPYTGICSRLVNDRLLAVVMRINLNGGVGREMARSFGIHSVPTFVVLDGEGQEVWRKWGFPNRSTIIEVISGIT